MKYPKCEKLGVLRYQNERWVISSMALREKLGEKKYQQVSKLFHYPNQQAHPRPDEVKEFLSKK